MVLAHQDRRDVIERALTLDFLPEARNLILMGTNGLGKTMIAQNICPSGGAVWTMQFARHVADGQCVHHRVPRLATSAKRSWVTFA